MNANSFNFNFEHLKHDERDAELRILIALNIDNAEARERMYAYVTAAPAKQWRTRAITFARTLQTWRHLIPLEMESSEAYEARFNREWDEALRTLASFLTPRKEQP